MTTSQNTRILRHLKTHTGITQIEALNRYGCMRLAARISELRDRGYKIVTVPKVVTNRYGEETTVAEYRLSK